METFTLADAAGSLLYIFVAGLYFWAGFRKPTRGAPLAGRAHWIGIALFFVGLAVFRMVQAEEGLRAILRGTFTDEAAYAERYAVQGPVAAALVLIAVAVGVWQAMTFRKRTFSMLAGTLATLGFIGLIVLRIISFHPLDQLIYASAGPLRVNYLLELGLLALAAYGVWLLRAERRARRMRKTRSSKVRRAGPGQRSEL
ncbi:hypothetical protein HME9302_00897 [Alteripontixanthobacter maritimus]|uniref:Uncharacterized protein n=1 Tax=Alteripontixanthobacter maritimus TaxID=2161824 RepID=A0A369Q845_9SPHN|nr:hypothetical protein [Alteripontixanthobacter maritimus]RDC59705.1 hypothetical protein HME9302_00897 [Alteripontixanthobacter maritimus]